MTVQELIDLLQEYAKPTDTVNVIASFYDGSSDVYDFYCPTIIVGYDEVTISPSEHYHVKKAQDGETFCTVHPDKTVT